MTGALRTGCCGLFLLALAACQMEAPPSPRAVGNSQTLEGSFDEVWATVIDIVTLNDMQIANLDKNNGIIAIARTSYAPDQADEGQRAYLEVVTDRIADLSFLVRQRQPGKVVVQLNTDFKMLIRTGNDTALWPYVYRWEDAYSNGSLERDYLRAIGVRLKMIQGT